MINCCITLYFCLAEWGTTLLLPYSILKHVTRSEMQFKSSIIILDSDWDVHVCKGITDRENHWFNTFYPFNASYPDYFYTSFLLNETFRTIWWIRPESEGKTLTLTDDSTHTLACSSLGEVLPVGKWAGCSGWTTGHQRGFREIIFLCYWPRQQAKA